MASKRPHMLFVDDEESIRLTLPNILERYGFEVKVAGSTADALSQLHSQRFDVLLSDLSIDEEDDGLSLTAAMRLAQPKCRTFILTGYPSFVSAQMGIRQGIDGYFTKPADVKDLVEEIKARLHHPKHDKTDGAATGSGAGSIRR